MTLPHQPNLLVPPTVLSVGGITSYIQALLEQDQELIQLWVTGEVSNASHHRSGMFFTLQDPDAAATIQCVIWNAYLEKLTILPESGEQVIVLGRIRLYPQRGQYQLMVWQVLPAGEGLRSLRYRQLRDRLTAEGLFDAERKRPLPQHPQAIAVVTSRQAAAWGDIKRTLRSRHPGLPVLLSPSLVQGEQAPPSIVAAIERVQQDGRADVLILTRGGGASEDMACFNDERVVRAIADCPIPVIAGIGHQRDESLADLAADVCAHTPTAAAELAAPRLSDLKADHQDQIVRLYFTLNRQLDIAHEHLLGQKLRLCRLQLGHRLERDSITLLRLRRQLVRAVQQQLHNQVEQHQRLQETLTALDPKGVLQRGYALVRTLEGTVVRNVSDLNLDQDLTVQLGQGTVTVRVTEFSARTPHPH
jgi:exodeoxyribonuclease VII large subunit